MANTQAMCASFKTEILQAYHNFGTTVTRAVTTADTFKAALYLSSATLNNSTTAYSTSGEVVGTNYTPGGVVVTNATPPAQTITTTTASTTYWTPSASIVYTNVTLTTAFDAVLIYNSTQSDRAVSVHTFGSQTITAGTFTLVMPVNAAGTALINIA